MKTSIKPENEAQRLSALRGYNILDTLTEEEFDNITLLASEICQTRISLISLIDENRQWFKSRHGLDTTETSRDVSFCAHAIHTPDQIFEIEDAEKDERFVDNPLHTGEPHVRFYAGVPLVSSEGYALGTLCVIDNKPNKLTESQRKSMRSLAQQVMLLLELRKKTSDLQFLEYGMDQSPEGIAWVDESASVIHFNSQYVRLTGYTEETLKNKKVYEFDPNMNQTKWVEHWAHMAHNKSMILETEFIGADGTVRMVELRLQYIDMAGTQMIHAMAIDISTRKESEAKLNENLYFLEQVQSIAHIGYWELDIENRKLYWSQETKRIHEVDELYEPSLEEGINFYDETSKPVITEKVTRAIELGESYDVQLSIITGKKNIKHVRAVGKAYFENGKATKLLGVFQDISNDVRLRDELERKIKQAKAASIAKDRFLSTMSHEIRTPLNGIVGTSYLLQNKDPKPEQKEYLNMLKFSSNHLLSLVNNVLDFGKIEEGKIELEHVNFSLKELVLSVAHPAQMQAEDKGLKFLLELDKGLWNFYNGDPTRIRQVLNNLISNALKFTDRGFLKIQISALEHSDKTEGILFSIEDSGIGISKEKLDRIFDEFAQEDSSTTRKYGGSGLGLSICQRLVQLMGSRIEVRSEENEGSSFSFKLTLPKGDSRVDEKYTDSLFDSSRDLSGSTILLVEDNQFNHRIAKDLLETWGTEVVSAFDGQQALVMASEKSFDLILMDLQMPNMDGYEATKRIRSLEGAYFQHVPIVALTASALVKSKVKVISVGMNDFITKPLNPNDFYRVIEKYLQRKTGKKDTSHLISLDYFNQPGIASSPADIKEYLIILEKSILTDISVLKKAIGGLDRKTAINIFHKNKSSLRTFGLNLLADQAAFFEETLATDNSMEELTESILAFIEDLNGVLKVLKKLINTD